MRIIPLVILCALVGLVLAGPVAAQPAPPTKLEVRSAMRPFRSPVRVMDPKYWKKVPPYSQMQGIWTSEPDHAGALTRLVVQGTRITAYVSGPDGDKSLGEAEAKWYVGGVDPEWLLDITRLEAAFTTDTASIEVALTLEKRGRLLVDVLVRYPDTSPKLDRWTRVRFDAMRQYMAKAMAPSIPMFPWPPPKASVRDVVPDGLATRAGTTETLGEIYTRMSSALVSAGFVGPAVYGIPGRTGFVVVTRLENIHEDGTPLDDRFSHDPRPDRPRSISEFLQALVDAPKGLYRVIVLAVTDTPVTEAATEPTRDQAELWLHQGYRWLPPEMASLSITGAHCEALIYEFQKASDTDEPKQYTDDLPALKHLSGAQLWAAELP